MDRPRYPLLYQLNTRVRLRELSGRLGRPATLDDLPDIELAQLADRGFDWLWLLGVWQTGAAGRQVSREVSEWQDGFRRTLPDLKPSDICGSCFAVTEYRVHDGMGGNAALERLRARMQRHGLRLMLDFVPNHVALDHPWVQQHPEFFIQGSEDDLVREPQNYRRLESAGSPLVLAYGRDPYFAGWPDTLQLDYANPGLQAAMSGNLMRVAGLCDGVRCDMAMLVEPQVFERTWGRRPAPFWPHAIDRVRQHFPQFLFMAEVYWDMEWTLQQRGFDYAYDKRLYDRLREGNSRPVREHLSAGLDYQDKLVRFLENHDEPRAASVFSSEVHQAAAVLSFLTPGMRFFHQGQLDGIKKHISPHLCRGPVETPNPALQAFYAQLLACLKRPELRDGDWRLLECRAAAQGNESWDGFIASMWRGQDGQVIVVVVNYAPRQGQCYVALPLHGLDGNGYRSRDLMGSAGYEHEAESLQTPGLYLDMAPWAYRVIELFQGPLGAKG